MLVCGFLLSPKQIIVVNPIFAANTREILAFAGVAVNFAPDPERRLSKRANSCQNGTVSPELDMPCQMINDKENLNPR